MTSRLVRVVVALGFIASCAGEEEDEGGGAVPSAECASGLRWAGGNAESSNMHPGGDCIGCHSSDEGPGFVVAGTVHEAFDEPIDCYGVPGVTVTITDATGRSVDLVTNEAGNFYSNSALMMPIRVRLEHEGRERVMTNTQVTGACASCHTQTGANGAPGRILAP